MNSVNDGTQQHRAAPNIHRPRLPLRVLGTSVTQTETLKAAAREDLGLKLEFITLDGTEAQRRGALNPDSFDVYDQWFHDIDLIWPTGSILPIDINRIDRWDEINALPKTGLIRPDLPRPVGGDPSKRLFVQLDGTLSDVPTDQISMLPTVHNADSFVVTGKDSHTVTSWSALLDPEWRGRTVLQADAAIGTLDIALALMARGALLDVDIGDLTLAEIDMLTGELRDHVKAGHFNCVWADEAEAVAALSDGKPKIGSLWWTGFLRLRAAGVSAQMVTPEEGYRGWFGGLAMSSAMPPAMVDAAYAYLNWWLDGRPGAIMAKSGAYMANPATVKRVLTEEEWRFWYEGEAASKDILNAEGVVLFRRGERREGGDYEARMSRVRVWDTVMNEHNYLVRQWQSALSPTMRSIRASVSEGIRA